MKKIYLSLLIIGISLLGFSQDKVYDEPDFSTFPPAGWSVLNDQGPSGTGNNWIKSCYPMVKSDVVVQDERLVSPTITCAAGDFEISFDYMSSFKTDEALYLLLSTDNGVTWDTYPYSGGGTIWTQSSATSDYWYNSGVIGATFATAKSIKLAFVYHTSNAVSDGYFAFDNVLVKQVSGTLPWASDISYKFESGIAASSWTVVNTPAPGSSQHFANRWLAKVDDDPGLSQDEWLKTKDYIISDNALTTVKLDIGWYALLNSDAIPTELKVSTDHGVSFSTVASLSTSTNWLQDFSYNLNAYKGDTVMFAINFTNTNTATTNFFLNSFKVSQVFYDISRFRQVQCYPS
jgi:hypothetical protein